jgi:WD40 repeat protein
VPVGPEREKLLPPIFFKLTIALLVLAGGLMLLLAVRMHYSESSKLLTTFQGHTAAVNSAVFSPDGRPGTYRLSGQNRAALGG